MAKDELRPVLAPAVAPASTGETLYSGYRWETAIELFHVRNRVYHSILGGWIQTDPLGYFDSMNLYLYSGNNPIRSIDSQGSDWLDTSANFAAGVGDSLTFGLTYGLRWIYSVKYQMIVKKKVDLLIVKDNFVRLSVMIKTSNINYQFQEWQFEKPNYDSLFFEIVFWLIGLPIVGLVLILPVQLLIRLLEVDNSIFIIRVLGVISIIVAMIFGFKKILKNRTNQYESWLEQKELREKELAGAYAEKFTITNIIQYWSIEEEEPIDGYLIRTQENEWFYIISDYLSEFEVDYFPKNQVTIIRAPLSQNILEILTQGREVEYMDTVQLYQFIDDYSYMDLRFDILDPALCQTLQASLLENG